jgi:MiaB-like tRNA modifying enzyme
VDENVEKARALVHAGARELRVTGQDTGVYGWDRNQGESLLPELLEHICAIEGDFRVRVGMANPKGVHGVRERLAGVFAKEDKLYNFLHVPVQSGSDEVLREMRRQHEVSEFREVCATFDEHLAEWTLATDVIAGFPTETDADHEQTVSLLEEVRPEKVNVTRFSKRPGTDAAEMKGHGGQTKKDRSSELADLRLDIVKAAYEELVGEHREVLVVEEGREDSVKCRDDAYHGIVIPEATDRGIEPGDWVTVEVTAQERVYAFGEPVDRTDTTDQPPIVSN